jgi:magnesium transporter
VSPTQPLYGVPAVGDNIGMYTAYVWYPDDRTEVQESIDATRAAWQAPETRLWIDVQGPTEEQLILLGAFLGLHVDAIEDCLFGEQRPRIDEYEDHLFLVFYGVLGTDKETLFSPRKLAVFVGDRFVLTVHREALRTLDTLRARPPRQLGQMLKRGAGFLLFTMVDGVVENYLLLAEQYEGNVEELEEAALAPSPGTSFLSSVSALRREILEVRRLVFALRELVLPLAKGEYGYLNESLEDRFRHVVDHIVQALEMLDAVRELLHGVQANYHAAVTTQTNQVMKTLTIFASIMLPLTFIVGVYGMNVPIWPDPETPFVFWGIVGSLGALSLGMLGVFRYLKWL